MEGTCHIRLNCLSTEDSRRVGFRRCYSFGPVKSLIASEPTMRGLMIHSLFYQVGHESVVK